jgi:hypothetical protein
MTMDHAHISRPEAISFPSTGGEQAHALYYPPKNKDFTGSPAEHPPLIVLSHGGPTSAAITTLRFTIQFWTNRGFAVADVNYGGSVGYFRSSAAERELGVVDDDCAVPPLPCGEGPADRSRRLSRVGCGRLYDLLVSRFIMFSAPALATSASRTRPSPGIPTSSSPIT